MTKKTSQIIGWFFVYTDENKGFIVVLKSLGTTNQMG